VGEVRNVYEMLVGNSEGKRPLGRPRRRWEDYIAMDLNEMGWKVVDWINVIQSRKLWRTVVNTVMHLRVPRKAGKTLAS
jgi:hypothetical protein